MENKKALGHVLAIFTIFIWGTTFISTKILLQAFQPVEILFFRFVIIIVTIISIINIIKISSIIIRSYSLISNISNIILCVIHIASTVIIIGLHLAITKTKIHNRYYFVIVYYHEYKHKLYHKQYLFQKHKQYNRKQL